MSPGYIANKTLLQVFSLLALCTITTQCRHENSPCRNEINLQSIVVGRWIWEETIRESNDGWSDTLSPQTENIKYAIEIYQEAQCSYIIFKHDLELISEGEIHEYSVNDTYFDDSRFQSHVFHYHESKYFYGYFLSFWQSFELNDSLFYNASFPFTQKASGDTTVQNIFRLE
jgi:hypothetical protein